MLDVTEMMTDLLIQEQKSVSPETLAGLGGGEGEGPVQDCEVIPSKVQMRFEAHDGEIMSTKWNSMGKYFATAGADRKIKIWEISRGGYRALKFLDAKYSPYSGINIDLKATLAGSNAAVMGIDFDTTGSLILGASNDFATRIWSVEDSRLRHTLTGQDHD